MTVNVHSGHCHSLVELERCVLLCCLPRNHTGRHQWADFTKHSPAGEPDDGYGFSDVPRRENTPEEKP